jgi:inosine-uridine nucleoside N-ribohydrolase
LTNIAALLIQYPEVRANIKQIVLMGGAIGMGNATAVAEFNVRQDPEAADIVFCSGLPIVRVRSTRRPVSRTTAAVYDG